MIVALLLGSLLRPLALAAAAGLLLRILRVHHPASRHAVWTAVLIGMLLLPLVSIITPQWRMPLLKRRHDSRPRAVIVGLTVTPRSQSLGSPPAILPEQRKAAIPSGETLIQWCYFAGLLAMLAYRAAGWLLARRLLSRSRYVRGCLRESADVLAPVAVGVLRPAVILPAAWRTWSAATRRAVLAHEFAHLRRHDTLTAALARFAKCVYWFHPLAWWIAREISQLAELSCDSAALERLEDPAAYARILLEFAESVSRAGHRMALPGLAMANDSDMGRRIDDVFALSGGNLRRLARPGALLALVGLPVMGLAAAVGLGEQQDADIPKFEVVSVKPCKGPLGGGGRGGGGGVRSPVQLDLACRPLQDLIRDAYDLFANGKPFQGVVTRGSRTVPIEGGPGWVASDLYSIEAKSESPQTLEMKIGPMMRTLLEDRFKLRIRHETREGPVYVLSVAKGGHKLKPVAPGDCTPIENFDFRKAAPGQATPTLCGSVMLVRGKMDFFAMSVADFCKNLGWNVVDRPVIDRTGIGGIFNIHVEFTADESTPNFFDPNRAAPDPTGPSIFTAVLEQLGLKLEPAKGPRDFLVIEHVERPTEN